MGFGINQSRDTWGLVSTNRVIHVVNKRPCDTASCPPVGVRGLESTDVSWLTSSDKSPNLVYFIMGSKKQSREINDSNVLFYWLRSLSQAGLLIIINFLDLYDEIFGLG